MKKSALLAVSALSLGIVGLSTFMPVVNAAPATADAKIQVTVQGQLGIGNEDGSAQVLDVTLDPMSANDMKEKAVTIKTTNNTDKDATLSVKDKDSDTNLVGATPTNTIPAGTNIAAGTSNWGFKVTGGSYKAMTATDQAIGTDADRQNGVKEFNVTYGVSTSAVTAADTYTDTVTYTITANN